MFYRFNVNLSNIDSSIYESLDFRLTQHPSENLTYLLTRVFAYLLSYQPNLQFSPQGLSDPDACALFVQSPNQQMDLWIEIGNPSAKKLNKATKAAKKVLVYTYKNPTLTIEEITKNRVHKGNEIRVYAIDPTFLNQIESMLKRSNDWTVMIQDHQVEIIDQNFSYFFDLKCLQSNSN